MWLQALLMDTSFASKSSCSGGSPLRANNASMRRPDLSTAFTSRQWYCVSTEVASAAGAVAVLAGNGAEAPDADASAALVDAPAACAVAEARLVPPGGVGEQAANAKTTMTAKAIFMRLLEPRGTVRQVCRGDAEPAFRRRLGAMRRRCRQSAGSPAKRRHQPHSTLVLRQSQPGVDDGVRIQRHRFDALVHQPLGEVRVIARTLSADADVLAFCTRRLDRHRQQFLDRRIALVEQAGDDRGIAIEAQRQLGEVVGTDREAVEDVEEFVGQQRVRRDLAHHDDFQCFVAADALALL